MISVHLTSIKTRDGVVLDGIVVEPQKKSQIALIWVHGLGSTFTHGQVIVKELSSQCQKNNIAYLKYNTRGHDIVNRDGPKGKNLQGAGFEKFEECIFDIRAVIAHAGKLGYKKIILAGHSTGANKIVYYLSRTHDKNVKGLALIGGVNDISAEIKRVGEKQFASARRHAEKLYAKDPDGLFTTDGYLWTAGRFLSLATPGKAEDTFPYYDTRAEWKAMKDIRVPVAVIFGSRDEYLDRPAKKLIEVFRSHTPSTKSFTGAIIKGADHSFKHKEKELSRIVIRFITGL